MARYSISIDGLGELSHQGRSSHWRGEVVLAGRSAPVALLIHGTASGPEPEQLDALASVRRAGRGLFEAAEPRLVALLSESGLEPGAPAEVFVIVGAELPALSYDPGVVHVFINLAHIDHPDDFLPVIDVIDGQVVGVLSGT